MIRGGFAPADSNCPADPEQDLQRSLVEVTAGHDDEPPPCGLKLLTSGDVLVPLIFSDDVMPPVVLDGQHQVGIAEVEPPARPPVTVHNAVVDHRIRKAGEGDQQTQPTLVCRIDLSTYGPRCFSRQHSACGAVRVSRLDKLALGGVTAADEVVDRLSTTVARWTSSLSSTMPPSNRVAVCWLAALAGAVHTGAARARSAGVMGVARGHVAVEEQAGVSRSDEVVQSDPATPSIGTGDEVRRVHHEKMPESEGATTSYPQGRGGATDRVCVTSDHEGVDNAPCCNVCVASDENAGAGRAGMQIEVADTSLTGARRTGINRSRIPFLSVSLRRT